MIGNNHLNSFSTESKIPSLDEKDVSAINKQIKIDIIQSFDDLESK